MPSLQLILLETPSCCVPYQFRIDDEKPEPPLGRRYREQASDLSLHLFQVADAHQHFGEHLHIRVQVGDFLELIGVVDMENRFMAHIPRV
jgi:hypothetical protein